MRTYKVKVPVTVSITWSQELVEDKENFYIRLKPHINLGGVKGANALTRTQVGGVSRYVLTKAYNDLIKQIKADKEGLKQVKDIVTGKKAETKVQAKTPVSTLPKLSVHLSQEDLEAGATLREESMDTDRRTLSTGWSQKDREKLEKGE